MRGAVLSLFSFLLVIQVDAARSQSSLWLPPGSRMDTDKTIPELIRRDSALEGQALLGKLLFKSPSILGEKAVRIGLSCNSCHPSGHVNTNFYIEGLSGKPGTIDLTNQFWRDGTEDKVFNPVPIPSLRNIRETAPYGTLVERPTMAAFTRHVIVTEFGGPEPSEEIVSALVSYMSLLENANSPNMPIQVNEIPISSLISLLEDPLKNQNTSLLEMKIDLIKEELGRRFLSNRNQHILEITAALKEIQKSANEKFEKANEQYTTLTILLNKLCLKRD